MTANAILKSEARQSLRGKWGNAALTYLVFTLIIGASAFVGVGPIILSGPLMLGLILYLKRVKAGDSPALEVLFSGFDDFLRSFLAYLLMTLAVAVGMILLVVPGIILSFGLAMTMFIVADDKDIKAVDALRRSWDMMKGYKLKLFGLILHFIGWYLLVIITFGILSFWVMPWMQLSFLNFYEDVKADWQTRNPANA